MCEWVWIDHKCGHGGVKQSDPKDKCVLIGPGSSKTIPCSTDPRVSTETEKDLHRQITVHRARGEDPMPKKKEWVAEPECFPRYQHVWVNRPCGACREEKRQAMRDLKPGDPLWEKRHDWQFWSRWISAKQLEVRPTSRSKDSADGNNRSSTYQYGDRTWDVSVGTGQETSCNDSSSDTCNEMSDAWVDQADGSKLENSDDVTGEEIPWQSAEDAAEDARIRAWRSDIIPWYPEC